jgi:hypothetical protein
MKKSILICFVAVSVFFSLSSCTKEKPENVLIEESYSKTLKVNESTTFTLPGEQTPYTIFTAASHASLSIIGIDKQGNTTYSYTPEKDYIGTDYIVISSEEKRHSKGGHQKSFNNGGSKAGHCNGGNTSRIDYKLTFNITIVKEVPVGNTGSEISNSAN